MTIAHKLRKIIEKKNRKIFFTQKLKKYLIQERRLRNEWTNLPLHSKNDDKFGCPVLDNLIILQNISFILFGTFIE